MWDTLDIGPCLPNRLTRAIRPVFIPSHVSAVSLSAKRYWCHRRCSELRAPVTLSLKIPTIPECNGIGSSDLANHDLSQMMLVSALTSSKPFPNTPGQLRRKYQLAQLDLRLNSKSFPVPEYICTAHTKRCAWAAIVKLCSEKVEMARKYRRNSHRGPVPVLQLFPEVGIYVLLSESYRTDSLLPSCYCLSITHF